jgi:beta-aspartyl-dipeptidase (metallo-type)
MFTLIENGEIYSPKPIGKSSVFLADGHIQKIGEVDRRKFESLDVEVEVIDAKGCFVVPGLIDPHQHLLGGSGESGFASQTPELSAGEIVKAGITSVVGCLGVDTTMKTMPGLLGKVKGLKEEGLSAYMWTGGYNVPPTTITGTPRNDIMFIEEIIGVGEIAVSDERSTDPTIQELARLSNDVYVGGMLSKKAGVSHFHVGERDEGLQLIIKLMDDFRPPPETIYATHIQRSEKLMGEAAELSKRGCFVDIDTVDEDLEKQLKMFIEKGGDLKQLTISSDASITGPSNVFSQIRECILKHKFPMEQILTLASANAAKVLKLGAKGRLAEGNSADILIVKNESLEIRDVISSGKRLMKNGSLSFKEAFLKDSSRVIILEGEKAEKKRSTGTKA